MAKQTDNHDPRAKLELRRYFLRKYHADKPPDVLDCCQGGGLLWPELRKEFAVSSYWGLDLKPKKGRLKLDSIRVLQQPGWPQNVVDVDTYGSPWRHWEAMLPNIQRPTTVFLTIGNQNQTASSPNAHGADVLFSFPPSTPPTLSGIVSRRLDVTYGLAKSREYRKRLVEAVEAISDGNARYIGVRLEPQGRHAAPVLCPRCQSQATPSGEVAGHPLYSCEACTVQQDVLGTPETVAFLFAIRGNLPVDPVSFQPFDVTR